MAGKKCAAVPGRKQKRIGSAAANGAMHGKALSNTPHARQQGRIRPQMTVNPDPELVRQLVLRSFGEAGWRAASIEALAETILITDGKYRGRSYRADGLLAMWLVEMGLLQVYTRDGQMLETINLFEAQGGMQRAA